MENGRVVYDAPRGDAKQWLAHHHPSYVDFADDGERAEPLAAGDLVCAVDAVAYAYGGGSPVIAKTSLTLHRGEVVALTGPNGSGKTTVAKLAAGLLEPLAGIVRRSGTIGFLAQDAGRHVVTERVLDEVTLGGTDDLGALRSLEAVGLGTLRHRHPQDLSSGERERLALAAVLALEPDLLVLDEPTRGVDPERKAELARRLRVDARERATLVVTHDAVFARAVADRVVTLGRPRESVLA